MKLNNYSPCKCNMLYADDPNTNYSLKRDCVRIFYIFEFNKDIRSKSFCFSNPNN